MSAFRSIVPSLLAVALCLSSFTSSAASRSIPRGRYDQAQAYQNDIEARMQNAQSRIAAQLQRQGLRPSYQQQILGEVSWSMKSIRQRVAGYSSDRVITREEAADVQALANAIEGELYNHYGNLAYWNLLS